jgi:hypothetical protein
VSKYNIELLVNVNEPSVVQTGVPDKLVVYWMV